MPLGKVSAGNFSKGNPVTHANGRVIGAGNQLHLSSDPEQDFGNPKPGNKGNQNVVSWTPSPAQFGNQIGGTPQTPTFDVPAGTYAQPQIVLIISEGAMAIYFTIDGTNPTTASPLYEGSVRVNVTTTIKALAVTGATQSSVATATFTIT